MLRITCVTWDGGYVLLSGYIPLETLPSIKELLEHIAETPENEKIFVGVYSTVYSGAGWQEEEIREPEPEELALVYMAYGSIGQNSNIEIIDRTSVIVHGAKKPEAEEKKHWWQ
ncbi:hypothetical protein LJC32_06700 [Oscillospiraceae bacterium OttesenSCG-928-F05]|nr:hypothetical protein [Oscillospiraceae bacterium OttesenSCG-928-F05]